MSIMTSILFIQLLLCLINHLGIFSNVLGFSPSMTRRGNDLLARTIESRKRTELQVINEFSFSNLSSDRGKESFEIKKRGATFNPKDIDIIPRSELKGAECAIDDEECKREESKRLNTSEYPFVDMLRDSANYIANHRNSIAVYHIPGEIVEWEGFTALMDDIALTWLLGMKIVIVVGCRAQINGRLQGLNDDNIIPKSRGITDAAMMRTTEEEAGYARFEVERLLNRCLKLHGGADLRVAGALNANVISGNFFVAEPVGVVDGVDYGYTGFPSRVLSNKIRSIHEYNDVVLLTSCGMSAAGERLNVKSELLAAHAAASLGASKVIYCSSNSMVLRNKKSEKLYQNFRLQDVKNMMQHYDISMNEYAFPSFGSEIYEGVNFSDAAFDFLLQIGWSALALENGVERAHIIAPTDGALVTELFTAKEGSGICISEDEVDMIHPDENFYGDGIQEAKFVKTVAYGTTIPQ